MDEDRVRWNAFKKEHKSIYPLVSKLDKKYYQRLRIVYKAQRDCVQTLDPWLRNGLESISDCNISDASFGGCCNGK